MPNATKLLCFRTSAGFRTFAALLLCFFSSSFSRADDPVDLPVYEYQHGLIRRWKLLGPFPRDAKITYQQVKDSLETGEPIEFEGRQVEWYSQRSHNGVMHLVGDCIERDFPPGNAKFFAACWLQPSSSEDRDFYFGADDNATFWIDDEVMHNSQGPNWYLWNGLKRAIALEKGKKHLCVVEARNEGGSFTFSVASSREITGRVTHFNGATPLQGVEVAAVDSEKTLLAAVASDANGEFTLKKIPYEAEITYECSTGKFLQELLTREDGSQLLEIQTLQPQQYIQEVALPLGRVPKRPVTAICPLDDGGIVFALDHEPTVYALYGDRVDKLFTFDSTHRARVSQILVVGENKLAIIVDKRLRLATLNDDSTYTVSELAIPSVETNLERFVECATLDQQGNLWCCTTEVTEGDDADNATEDDDIFTIHQYGENLQHVASHTMPFRCISMCCTDSKLIATSRWGSTVSIDFETNEIQERKGPGEYTSQIIISDAGRLALILSASVATAVPDEAWQITSAYSGISTPGNRGAFLGDDLFFVLNNKILLHQGRTFRQIQGSERTLCVASTDTALLCGMSNGTILRIRKAPYRRFGIEYGLAFQPTTRVIADENALQVFSAENLCSVSLARDGTVTQTFGKHGVPVFMRDGTTLRFGSHAHFQRRMTAVVQYILLENADGETQRLNLGWDVGETILNTIELDDGQVLIGTENRMHLFDLHGLSVETLSGDSEFDSMARSGTSAFYQADDSTLYAGSLDGGVFQVDLAKGTAQKLLSIESDDPSITALHLIDSRRLLVGTVGGAFELNLDQRTYEPFSDDVIGKASIQEFLSTTDGLLYVASLDAGIFSNYKGVTVPLEGLPALHNAEIVDIHLGPKEELIIGTTGGVLEYHPTESLPRLWLTSLEVDGSQTSLQATSELEEGSSLNLGLSTDAPNRISAFRYRIGDQPWIQLPAGTKNVRYNLAGVGPHQIQFQAIDRDHNYSSIHTATFNSYLPIHRWLLVRWSVAALGLGIIGLLIGSSIKTLRAQRQLIETERNARESAEENVAERERLLQRVSHDLRNPLFVVAGCAEMIELGQMEAKAALPILNETVDSMTYLSRQLLSYSKAKTGRRTAEHSHSDVGQLLRTLRDEAYIANREQQVDLRLEIAQGAKTHLAVSPQILKEILHNLLNNSIKFTTAGEIVVHYHTESGQPTFCVEDTGCGMDQETLDCLFKPFFKQTNRRPGNGFGLGLSICKALSDEIGATLSVESEVGRGTNVSLRLPADSISDQDSTESSGENESFEVLEASNQSNQPKTAQQRPDLSDVDGLLVDDLRFVRDVLVKRLDAVGVTVYDCNSTSIPDLSKFHPKFVLTDLEMPVSSGFDIAQRIKEIAPSVVVIAISERSDLLEEAEKCEHFDIVLTKVSLLTNAPETLKLFRQFANTSTNTIQKSERQLT